MPPEKKKPSGVNIPDSQRHTTKVQLRLPPEKAKDLDTLAERWSLTRSEAVVLLLDRAMKKG